MRVDRVGGDDLAGGVHDGDLHAGAQARVEAHRRAGPGGRGEQQVAQVRGEHADRLVLGLLPQPGPQVDAEVHEDPGAPGPADGVRQPLVGRAALVGDLEPARDLHLVGAARGRVVGGLLRLQVEVEDLFLLAPEQREDAVRGQFRERLGEVEVVGELGAALLLAVADPRDHPALVPHALAQRADEVGVLGEPLDEDGAGALQRGRLVRDALLRVHVGGGLGVRVAGGVGQQQLGERFKAGLAGDLRLGAPLRLVREVDVLQPGLGVGRHDLRAELVGELALRLDRLQDRGAPLVQLAQVAQPLLHGAELRVVERSGRLLAVAGDERDGRPAVEQVHRDPHLPLADADLVGDALGDGRRGRPVPAGGRLADGRCHSLDSLSPLGIACALSRELVRLSCHRTNEGRSGDGRWGRDPLLGTAWER